MHELVNETCPGVNSNDIERESAVENDHQGGIFLAFVFSGEIR